MIVQITELKQMRILAVLLSLWAAVALGACPTVTNNFGTVGYINNIGYVPAPDATSVEIQCTYNGYYTNGTKSATYLCTEGEQTVIPTCTLYDCGAYPSFVNGTTYPYGQGKTTYDSQFTLTCNPGNILVSSKERSQFKEKAENLPAYDSREITCRAGGWETGYSCQYVECGPVAVARATIEAVYQNTTAYGASFIVTCERGYYYLKSKTNYDVSESLRCERSGTYSPALVSSCTSFGSLSCAALPNITNAVTTLKNASLTPAYPGDLITVTCDKGYRLWGDSRRMRQSSTSTSGDVQCGADLSWQSRYVTCVKVRCPLKTGVTNGNFTLTDPENNAYLATATVTCNDGYRISDTAPADVIPQKSKFQVEALRSSKVVTCEADGSWTPASCVLNTCAASYLTKVTDGNVTLDKPSEAPGVGSTATVSCPAGSYPALDNRSRRSSASAGSVVKAIELMSGGSASTVITCDEEKGWPYMYCEAVTCAVPSNITNGKIVVNGLGYGATANVTCNTGYFVSGTQSSTKNITCEQSGLFSSVACVLASTSSKADETQVVTIVVQFDTLPNNTVVAALKEKLDAYFKSVGLSARVVISVGRIVTSAKAQLLANAYSVQFDVEIAPLANAVASDSASAFTIAANIKQDLESSTSTLSTSLKSVSGATGTSGSVSTKGNSNSGSRVGLGASVSTFFALLSVLYAFGFGLIF